MSSRCFVCVGSGQILGGGMMMAQCPNCSGIGYLSDDSSSKSKFNDRMMMGSIDKRSKSYRDAIAKIMDVEDVDRRRATEIFCERYESVLV